MLGVALVAALVLLIVAVSLLTVRGVIRFSGDREKPARSASPVEQFPEPRLEPHPAAGLAASAAKSEKELDSYGWVDRKARVAHIPIDRAMSLLLERGLPDVGGGQTRLQLMEARPTTDIQPKPPLGLPAPERTVSP